MLPRAGVWDAYRWRLGDAAVLAPGRPRLAGRETLPPREFVMPRTLIVHAVSLRTLVLLLSTYVGGCQKAEVPPGECGARVFDRVRCLDAPRTLTT